MTSFLNLGCIDQDAISHLQSPKQSEGVREHLARGQGVTSLRVSQAGVSSGDTRGETGSPRRLVLSVRTVAGFASGGSLFSDRVQEDEI